MLRATRHSRGASRSTHDTQYSAFWSSSCAIPPAASRSCSHHVLLANAKVPLTVFLRLRDLMDHPRWLLLLCQFALESSRILNRGARTEILKLENLAKLDLAFCCFAVRRGAVLGPVDRFFFRVDLDQPIAGDQVLGLGERAFNDVGFPPENLMRAPSSWGAGLLDPAGFRPLPFPRCTSPSRQSAGRPVSRRPRHPDWPWPTS